ncbi:MAG: UvrD-helicase domain-containing protein, partial [Pseudolabrys sp.]
MKRRGSDCMSTRSTQSLNRPQRDAVLTRAGPLLVLAGAGTGKTRVITYRIAELIRSGVRPDRILAVTFTRKAAAEMKQRALALLKAGRRRRLGCEPEISTFHSLCVRVLRRQIPRLGYPKNFVIYDRADQESLARAALRDIRVGHQKLRPGDLLALISVWKSRSLRADAALEAATTDREQLAALAYARYQETLRARGGVDYDDLLLCTEELFTRFPRVRTQEAGRFDHVLIDEYQDTNALQYRIVQALAERHRNLCVVGDDDQSLYGWRGAELEHILHFSRDWPDAKIVKLEDNYRSREPILMLANQLIVNNHARHDKLLRAARQGGPTPRFIRFEDDATEAQSVAQEIRTRLQATDGARVRAYVLVGGLSFFDRKEVRDVVSYLRVLVNPADEVSLLRIINTPPRGIGNTTIQSLLAPAVAQGRPLWEVLPQEVASGKLAPGAAPRLQAFVALVHRYRREADRGKLTELLTRLLEEIDYRAELV